MWHECPTMILPLKREVGTATPVRRPFGYDAYARSTYDEFGRVFQAFDGAQTYSGLEYTYNNYGYVQRVDEAANSATSVDTYYTINEMDARGNVTSLSKGGMTIVRSFDAQTGRPTDIDANTTASQTVQDLNLVWDVVGNLEEKRDRSARVGGSTKDILETYLYDDLHRLTDVDQDAQQTLDMSYEALGNITQKRAYTSSGATDNNANVSGTYSYTSGTHRVSSAGSASYSYNANGSVTAGDGRVFGWGVFNKPISITKSGRSVQLLKFELLFI